MDINLYNFNQESLLTSTLNTTISPARMGLSFMCKNNISPYNINSIGLLKSLLQKNNIPESNLDL